MHPLALLLVYCLLCVAGSLVGGWVPLVVRLTHRRMQIAISFVSGMILGIGILHLLPHSVQNLGSIDRAVNWTLGGFLFMFFLERFFHFHHHEAEEVALAQQPSSPPLPHAHQHDHGHHDHAHGERRSHTAWAGAAVGLTLHSLVDGVAMAVAVQADDGHGGWAGAGAALAIALHKPFDSLSIGTLMAASGKSIRSRHVLNAAYALVTPVGAILFFALASWQHSQQGLGEALGFAAGAFLCIATSDLLPELQFHHHDRAWLSTALLAGIALAWSTLYLEGGSHSHDLPAHAGEPHVDHDHDHE
jgi:zinc and cadmium transporter